MRQELLQGRCEALGLPKEHGIASQIKDFEGQKIEEISRKQKMEESSNKTRNEDMTVGEDSQFVF